LSAAVSSIAERDSSRATQSFHRCLDVIQLQLILGCWLPVMLILAPTYAFAKRVDLQDVCDGAALAAANSVDLARARDRGVSTAGTSQRPSSL
jgi:hypothetical protein